MIITAGALALPAAAQASTTIGGDPSQGSPAHLIQCTGTGGYQQPCTITVDTRHGAALSVPPGKVITHYSGYFDANAMVGLRLMKRNPDGTFTSQDESGYTYADGGAQTFDTHIEVPATGSYTIALDLYGGSVGALADAGSRIFASDGVFSPGETGKGDPASYDVQFNVTVDDPAPPAPEPTPTPEPQPAGSPSPGPSGGSGGGSPSTSPYPAGLSFDARAILGADGKSVTVYARNETDQSLDGAVALKVGGKLYRAARVSDFDYHASEDINLPFGGKPLKALLKKGTLKATIVAKLKGTKGAVSKTVPVKVIRGGAKGYDGTYRGAGPLVIVVKRGVITALSQPMNTYCTTNGKFVMRTMQTGLGFPALIGKDGSFDHKASYSSDSFTYRGKLTRSGKGSGYNSLWYSSFDLSPEGKIRAVSCMQASNWTVKKG